MLNPREFCFGCMNHLASMDGKCPICGWDNRSRRNGEGQLPFALLANKYFIGRALGRGGFGITYVGLNARLNKRVAIKEYFPEGVVTRGPDKIQVVPVSPEMAAFHQEGMRKTLEEARIIGRVQNVPHVVRIYDCFGRNNTIYIVMEFIEGETLTDRVARNGAMTWREAWPLMRPIGEALDRLHSEGLIHRDVSPDNIMVSAADGSSVLLDFGAAGPRIHSREERKLLLKDGYAAPEQYQTSSEIDGRADEYSWAATFLYALTGRRPLSAPQRKYTEENDAWRMARGSLPKKNAAILRKSMSLNAGDRFATIDDLILNLEILSGTQSPARKALWAGIGLSTAIVAGSVAIGMLGG